MKEQPGKHALSFLDKVGFGNKELSYQNKEDFDNQNTSDLVDQPQGNHEFAGLENKPKEYPNDVYIVSRLDFSLSHDKQVSIPTVPYHTHSFLLEFDGYIVQAIEFLKELVKAE